MYIIYGLILPSVTYRRKQQFNDNDFDHQKIDPGARRKYWEIRKR